MQPTDAIATAWRALAGADGREGWRVTDLMTVEGCRLLAARLMPGDREALLAGFESMPLPHDRDLPTGRGFDLERVMHGPAGHPWLALSRREGASLPLFTGMVHDIVGVMRNGAPPMVDTFLRRIRLWQAFMSRDGGALLGPEAEIGLVGELHMLGLLVDYFADPEVLLDAWTGPAGGLHDFVIGNGAIEVKTSLSQGVFRADIGSLEQLDPSTRSPLCVAVVRLVVSSNGLTLPETIAQLRHRLGGTPTLDRRLMQAGYLPDMAEHHVRRFLVPASRLLDIDAAFPHLTPRTVPPGIVDASYTIELGTIATGQADPAGFLDKAAGAHGR